MESKFLLFFVAHMFKGESHDFCLNICSKFVSVMFHDFPVILHDVPSNFEEWWDDGHFHYNWWGDEGDRMAEYQGSCKCWYFQQAIVMLHAQNPTTVVFQALNQANYLWMLEMLEISCPQKSFLPGWRICTLGSNMASTSTSITIVE